MHKRGRRLQALVACAIFFSYWALRVPAIALPTAANPSSGTSSTIHAAVHPPINLNLSATSASVVAPARIVQTPVNIHVGGLTQSITSGQLLTPAEMIAVYQVLHGGVQNLVLGANGAATGGM